MNRDNRDRLTTGEDAHKLPNYLLQGVGQLNVFAIPSRQSEGPWLAAIEEIFNTLYLSALVLFSLNQILVKLNSHCDT